MYRVKFLKFSLKEGTDVDDDGREHPDGRMIVVGTIEGKSQKRTIGCARNGDMVVTAAELESLAVPEGHAVLALDVEEPVLLVRLGEAAGWVEHRYADRGWRITDVAGFEKRFFGITTSREVAEIEIVHPGTATIVLQLSDYFTFEERGKGLLFHVVDLDSFAGTAVMLMTTKGEDILEFKEW